MTDLKGKEIIFSERYIPDGKVSRELEEKLTTGLSALKDFMELFFKKRKGKDETPSNYELCEIYSIGSILRGRDTSDVDFYFRTRNTGVEYNNVAKTALHFLLNKDVEKHDQIDVYLGSEEPNITGFFAGWPKHNITNQVSPLIESYNSSIEELVKEA